LNSKGTSHTGTRLHFANWKDPLFFMGKSTNFLSISMVIFHMLHGYMLPISAATLVDPVASSREAWRPKPTDFETAKNSEWVFFREIGG